MNKNTSRFLSILIACLMIFSVLPIATVAAEGLTLNVTNQEELTSALNRTEKVDAINITADFTVTEDSTIQYDGDKINWYGDTVMTVASGVTLTIENGGAIGSFWPSYEGNWENPPFPNAQIINNGTIIIEDGGATVADFKCNNGDIIVNNGGSAVCCTENFGTVTVQSGGAYRTTQGGDAQNHGTVIIADGAQMESRFGTAIINCSDGVIQLDGGFICNCVRYDEADHMWFRNEGSVTGHGSVVVHNADPEVGATDLDAMIVEMMSQLGQTSRFDDWEDINIFKQVEVSNFEELQAAFPHNRVVAGENVEGDSDVIAVVTGDFTVTGEIATMGRIIVPEEFKLTVADGAYLEATVENYGQIEVESGGVFATTMGEDIENHGTLTVKDGGLIRSQMGASIRNDGVFELDGTFFCNCVRYDDTDHMWFKNNGTVSGHGTVILHNVAPDMATDLDGMIEEMMSQLGQTSRFDNWDDINIFKQVEVSSFEELQAAFPHNRVVAGENVEGDMDVIAVLTSDIVVTGEIATMGKIIVPEEFKLTVAEGAYLEAAVENHGQIEVEAGGVLATTMGGDIENYGSLTVQKGGKIKSQMGGTVRNEGGFELDGIFECGSYHNSEWNADVIWFSNSGLISGSGTVSIYDANPDNPVDLEALAAELVKELPREITVDDGSEKPPVPLPFTDVAEGMWYTEGIRYCYVNGLMNGTSPTTFAPNAPFTRAMFVTVLANIEGADVSAYKGKPTSFKDVKPSDWFAPYVEWAYANGYTSGTGVGIFSPNTPVTREMIAQFFYNYSSKKGFDVSQADDLERFTDKNTVSGWAKRAVQWAVACKLINGMSPTTLAPKNTATRAQVALISATYHEGLMRFASK